MTWSHLTQAAAQRSAAGLDRSLRSREQGEQLLDLAGNDYLGLSDDPRVVAAAQEALRAWGAGATASRLITGSIRLHEDLEAALAAYFGAAGALVFSSGYLANLAAITALADDETLIVSDAFNHASIVDACRLSRADVVIVPHRDIAALSHALEANNRRRALVVTESVFSVDGDAADLSGLYEVSSRHGAALLVDEAHSFGVVGEGGSVAAAGLAGREDVVITATLSKAAGAQGGAIIAAQPVIEHLINTARPLIFDTGLAPAATAAALAAVRIMTTDPDRCAKVREAARRIHGLAVARGLEAAAPDGAVVSVVLPDARGGVAERERWRSRQILVGLFRPPSVPDGRSRLRLTAKATLTESDFEHIDSTLAGVPTAVILPETEPGPGRGRGVTATIASP